MSSGYSTFTSAWPATGFDVPVLLSGTDREPVPLLEFAVSANTNVLANQDNNGESSYSETLWYSGNLDLWAGGWPTNDPYFTLLTPYANPANLEAYTCSDVATSEDGGPCAAPAAPAAPAHGRRHLTSQLKPCANFYRQVQFASSLALIAQPPDLRNVNWTLNSGGAQSCGNDFNLIQIPVSQVEYTEDLATMPWPGAPPAWCNVWGTLSARRPNATYVTIRSADDPYVLAGADTDCTYRFGLPKSTFRHWGLTYLLLPGLAVCSASLLVVLCLVARRRASQRLSSTRKESSARAEGTPLAGAGIFTLPPKAEGYGATGGAGAMAKGFQRVSSASRARGLP